MNVEDVLRVDNSISSTYVNKVSNCVNFYLMCTKIMSIPHYLPRFIVVCNKLKN